MNDIDTINRPNPFTVPEGFFDRNREVIVGRIARRRRIMFIRRSAIAAAVTAVAFMAWSPWSRNENMSPDERIDMFISQASDSQLSDAIQLADAEYLFDSQQIGHY